MIGGEMKYSVEKLIAKHLELRNAKAMLEKETKENVSKLEEGMSLIETALKAEANRLGVTSFRTTSGTAFLTTVDRASVADWDMVLEYITTNNKYDLLNRAVNKTAVKEFVETNKIAPPGVNYTSSVGINIRKPTAKVEDLGE